MKKNKFIMLLISLIAITFAGTVSAQAKTVNVYFFRSSTCSHCQEAKAFFEELQQDEEYKDLFVINDYEISSKKNMSLMEKVVEKMGNNSSGAVPYIIIGDKAFLGYSSSSDDEIKAKIKEVYEDEDFVDPLTDIINDANSTNNDGLIALGILVGTIILISVGVYFARKDTTKLEKAIENEEKKNEEIKTEKVEIKEEKPKKASNTKIKSNSKATKKTTATKKATSTKNTATKKTTPKSKTTKKKDN